MGCNKGVGLQVCVFNCVQLFATHCWPGSSVHGILQARILEWVAIPFSRGFSWPRDWTQVSCIAGRFFTVWAIREAQNNGHKSNKRNCILRWTWKPSPIDNIHLSQKADLTFPTYLLGLRVNRRNSQVSFKKQKTQVSPSGLRMLADSGILFLELNVANYF